LSKREIADRILPLACDMAAVSITSWGKKV
jgi:hypothetical protein